ncbi:polysaccharide deacetylase family protein [Pseudonocardia hierapolitana]|uniref:polysaccharide deacetylase family protein n=1 Tax=Pseudonocardia hierapolitana TaxID=1128676 RepID=UPI0014795CDA|nr:polysaccharide deacetylase family protein [Pseudonocardia hierapolitana]
MRILVATCALLVSGCTTTPVSTAAPPPKTFVSLTFDDGHASHYAAAMQMRARGLAGTFYISSGLMGSSTYYMPWWQVYNIAEAGSEIGGHTMHHADLSTADAVTVRREVCDDRYTLLNQGFSPVSGFAYPGPGLSPVTQELAKECGYSTGRGVGGLFNRYCVQCPAAETMPPEDPYKLKTAFPARAATTLADLQAVITNAETNGGGWAILVFHGVCDDGCTADLSVATATFTALLDWLAPRAANGTVVRTVGQVAAGGAVTPQVTPWLSCT